MRFLKNIFNKIDLYYYSFQLPHTYEYILPGHSFVSINYGSPRSGNTINTFRNFDRSGSALRNELDRSGNAKNGLDRTENPKNDLDRSENPKNDLDRILETEPNFSLDASLKEFKTTARDFLLQVPYFQAKDLKQFSFLPPIDPNTQLSKVTPESFTTAFEKVSTSILPYTTL